MMQALTSPSGRRPKCSVIEKKDSLCVELVTTCRTKEGLGGFGVVWMAGEDRKGGCNRDSVMCAWCLITGINTSSGQYRVLVIATVKPASYQHCSDGHKGNLGRQQKSHHYCQNFAFWLITLISKKIIWKYCLA